MTALLVTFLVISAQATMVGVGDAAIPSSRAPAATGRAARARGRPRRLISLPLNAICDTELLVSQAERTPPSEEPMASMIFTQDATNQ